jgi:hypothetical protein
VRLVAGDGAEDVHFTQTVPPVRNGRIAARS